MNQEILLDIGGTITNKFFLNSIQQVPTSAFITVYDDTGTEVVAKTAATIDGDGTMSYAVAAGLCDEVKYNYKAVWEFVVDYITKYQISFFNIVRHGSVNPVVDDDIILRAPFVKSMNYRRIETATAGTKTVITCPNLTEESDYWTAGTVEILEGTNEGEKRKVVASDPGSLVADSEFTAAINSTSRFVVVRSFNREIQQAYAKFEADLFQKKIKINQLINAQQIKEYLLVLVLYYICSNFTKSPLDIWFEKAKEYKKEYAGMMANAVFDLDEDDDGVLEATERGENISQIRGQR